MSSKTIDRALCVLRLVSKQSLARQIDTANLCQTLLNSLFI